MKTLLTAVGIPAATLLLLTALLWTEPFERVNDLLDRVFGAAPKWTQVETLVKDPNTQETSHGDRPVPSLETLAAYWSSHPGARHAVFIGNSQMLAMSLAPGEPAATATERTYVDQVSDYYQEHGGNLLCYRLSAPGMSYAESLWYLEYLLQNPALRPDGIILQINYQAFWNGGIRDTMLEMLQAPAFRTRVEAIAHSSQSYAEYFDEALKSYARQQAKSASAAKSDPSFGYTLETRVREPFTGIGLQAKTEREKDSIEQMLYRGRLYFLRLKPSNARSISGPRLLRSQAAVEGLAERCREAGIKLVLFTAPLNPRVSLYRDAEDKTTYETFVDGVAHRFDLPLYHFDDLVAAEYWGRLLNGPDPLHMGRRGHQIVAAKMIEVVQKTVPENSRMQFNSYSYLLFLAIVTAIFWVLNPPSRRVFVLLVSVLFYASWSIRYAPLPFVLCAGVSACAQRMMQDPARVRRWLWIGVTFTLSILVFFKYRQFVLDNVNLMLQTFGQSPVKALLAIGLPLGISFYSFEAISYLIDTKQGRAKNVSFMDLTMFVTFWPHLIAGPIVRVRELIPQFTFQKRFETAMMIRGLDRLIWGLVQKNLIANNLGAFVDEGFLPQAALLNTTVDNWFLAFAFGLQIYFDFASYSNMAIGTAQLLGIVLPENFRFPYHAANPADFWSRWHMTLSRWIRDYLFFPVNARYKAAPGPLYASLIGIMALVGLWHGAGWGFVVWGVMHGVYLVLFRMWEGLRETRFPKLAESRIVGAAWQVFTLFAVMAAWVPFRAASIGQAMRLLRTMTLGHSFHPSYSINLYLITSMVIGWAAIEPYVSERFQAWESRIVGSGWQTANWFVLRPLLYAFGLLLFLAFDDRNMQFIYFQF